MWVWYISCHLRLGINENRLVHKIYSMCVVWYKIEIQSSLDEFHVGEFFQSRLDITKFTIDVKKKTLIKPELGTSSVCSQWHASASIDINTQLIIVFVNFIVIDLYFM